MKPNRPALLCIVMLFFLIGQIICSQALGADELTLDSPNGGDTLKGAVQKIAIS